MRNPSDAALAISASFLVAFPLSLRANPDVTPLENQARQTLHREGQVPARRDFVKTAFRSTALAVLRQPITTFRLGKAIYWRRGLAFAEDNLPIFLAFPQAPPPPPGSPEFENHLDRFGLPKAVAGDLDYFVGGPAFFREFERQVADARRSIDVQVFIFDNDDVSVHCADLLRARAAEIPVRVLFDDLGSTFAHGRRPPGGLPDGFEPPEDIGNYLVTGSEVQLRQTVNPWLVTDHTKLLLFDRQTAFIGGMNFGRESRHLWHDLMVGVRGPILELLARDYNLAWEKTGPRGDLALFDQPAPLRIANGPGAPLRILRTDAVDGRSEILIAMLQAIKGATSRIWIETPYFASDAIAHDLEAAAARGLDVRLIIPSEANHGIMDAGNLATARSLLRAGVKVWRYPRMTHLKAMICDSWATVGSANLDTISLRINRELNLSFSDPHLIRRLEEAVFTPDFKASKPLEMEDTELLLAPLIESIADQL